MKPITLTITAFGPYAGRQVIDFSQLENRKMFVISGKTGAGKTTIFDALSFAMYGKPSGDQRSASEMRSQFADPKQPTEVSLLFQLKGRTFFIRRSPQQEKPKARGGGMTTVGAAAELYEKKADGSDELLAANVRDTDEKVNELIGLEANQFRQILMIPQGEFQKLLISGSQEKEKILQKLFQTSFYKRVEDVLKERADALKKKAGKAAGQQAALLKSLPAYSLEMRQLLEEEEVQKEAIFKQLDLDLLEMNKQHKALQQEIDETSRRRDFLLGERERGIARNAQFDRLENAIRNKNQLDERKEEIERKESQINWAVKAEKIVSYEMLEKNAGQTAHTAIERKDEAEKAMQEAARIHEKAESQFKKQQDLQPVRNESAKQLQKLQSMEESVKIYQKTADEVKAAEERLTKIKQEGLVLLKKDQESLNSEQEVEQALISLQTSREKYLEAGYLIEKLKALLDQFQELSAARRVLKEQEEKEKAARLQAEKTAEYAANSRKQLQRLRDEWSRGQAAVLAGQLKEGEACSVCGALHHPNPAAAEASYVSERELEEAEKQAGRYNEENKQAEQNWMEVRFAMKNTQENVANSEKKLQKDFQVEETEARLKQADRNYQKAKQDMERKAKLEQELLRVKQLRKQSAEKLEENKTAEISENTNLIEKKSLLHQLEQAVPEPMREHSYFQAELSRLKKETELMQKQFEQAAEKAQKSTISWKEAQSVFKERQQSQKEAEAAWQEANAVFLQACKEAGFESMECYQTARQLAQSLADLKGEVKQYEQSQRELFLLITELKDALKGSVRADIVKFEEDIELLNPTLAHLTAQSASITAQIKDSIRIQESIKKIAGQIAEAEEAYRLAGHLYEVTHGKNELKVTFERYVLASFLEDILASANTRLTRMTNGRFQLQRLKERSKGNAQSGLDLLAFDQYTGASRHVKTLSGGETFKAALALALGLAEVVQNYAGGVSLETMFVDEGFGTLDPESLDQAVETLMDIQADGRLVGIISHVPELKERIDARLEVGQSDTGSKAKFVFTGEG
ncbi:SbcC/MukB-like Walker B domain-containing protein [Domibacillus indicus]|uniref:SbcC/MukB-like Walker B domain-containing protein n=1 Tax=Domibacillus indicus TaxID=1437523 RepID=UPI000617F81F|nr:SMC family ATPase [Domibacillus indicus]